MISTTADEDEEIKTGKGHLLSDVFIPSGETEENDKEEGNEQDSDTVRREFIPLGCLRFRIFL